MLPKPSHGESRGIRVSRRDRSFQAVNTGATGTLLEAAFPSAPRVPESDRGLPRPAACQKHHVTMAGGPPSPDNEDMRLALSSLKARQVGHMKGHSFCCDCQTHGSHYFHKAEKKIKQKLPKRKRSWLPLLFALRCVLTRAHGHAHAWTRTHARRYFTRRCFFPTGCGSQCGSDRNKTVN